MLLEQPNDKNLFVARNIRNDDSLEPRNKVGSQYMASLHHQYTLNVVQVVVDPVII